MKAIYSIDENDFVGEIPEIKKRGYVIETECEHTGETVLNLILEDDELHLHNEVDYSPLVLEYFREKDLRFMLHVDFFSEDNPHMIPDELKIGKI